MTSYLKLIDFWYVAKKQKSFANSQGVHKTMYTETALFYCYAQACGHSIKQTA